MKAKAFAMRKTVFLFALFFPLLLPGQTGKLTIDDLLNIPLGFGRGDTGILEAPDGSFTVVEEHGQVAIQPAGGGAKKILTSSPDPKSELALSPDGKSVAYISQGQVWVVNVSGGDPLELTHDSAGPGDPRGATDHHPQWNPHGKWILYEAGSRGFNELYVVSEDGKTWNLLAATELYYGHDVRHNPSPDQGDSASPSDAVASDRFDAHPLWSPDGTRVSYTERSREFFSGKLQVIPFDPQTGGPAGLPLTVYVAKNDPGGAWAINTVSWSPNSKTLAVVLQLTHWDKVWLIPSTGGEPKELTFGTGEDEDPQYSPDGKWIAFESNRDLAEERHIWVIPSSGGNAHRITHLTGIENPPHWIADSKGLKFQWRSTLGSTAIYEASVSGEGEPHLLGEVHHSIFEDRGIVPEVARFKGLDGMPLAGILYRPADYKPGTRYPTVLLAHGGPEGQDTLSVDPWAFFLAQEGYVVLMLNFRGSTGYGEQFRNANVKDSGGGEIDDFQASINYLVDAGLTDPKHVGISGGSHGGTVVANAVARYPDTYAAGIEKFGVVDRALFLVYTNRNSEIRWETKMGGTPEQVPEVYRKADVLLEVDRIKTPLLVLHGEEDPQVPPQESQQFAALLKKDEKVFTYITYPGEGHGFRQLAHRKDADEQEFAFLNKYLKPGTAQ
jgi:dipeptidyl aminopeptidase/acylaminoacyl peptidase